MAAMCFSTSGPTESESIATGAPSSSESCSAIGPSDISGVYFPPGRPRCDARMTFAPRERAYWIVLSDARIRVASVSRPFLTGALKSTRMNTRRPSIGSCSMLFTTTGGSERIGKHGDHVAHARGEPHFVVVPRQDLGEPRLEHLRDGRVEDRRMTVAVEVSRDELLLAVLEDAFHRTIGGRADSLVDLLDGRLLLGLEDEVDDRNIGRGDADRHAVELAL